MKKNLILFSTATILGFLFPNPGILLKKYLLIQLIILMSFSLKSIKLDKPKKKETDKIAINFLAGFIPLLTILASYFLVKDPDYLKGIILWSIMPPAIGIISLSKLVKANVKETTINESIQYISYLILTPLLGYVFLKTSISVVELFKQIIQLILLPFLISRVLKYENKKVDNWIISLTLAVVFYTLISINSKNIPTNTSILIILLIFLTQKFATFFIIKKFIQKNKNYDKTDKVDLLLFSTLKNGGLAGVIALNLLNTKSTLPITIEILTFIIFITFFDYYYSSKKNIT